MVGLQNRRRFLIGLMATGAVGLGGSAPPAQAEPPPEVTTIRLPIWPTGNCTAPLYVAEDLLRTEGFSEVRYVLASGTSPPVMLANGDIDFDMEDGFDYLPMIDAGKSLTLLSGMHTGCFELRARDGIGSVSELRGRKIGINRPNDSGHLFVSAVAAYVGLNPAADIEWVADPSVSGADLFAAGKIDAFVGFPPNPQEPCARILGHSLVNMARDPPWSRYFCCMAAANADFVRSHPVATKRALRALLKGADLCHSEPELAAQHMSERGYSKECALMTLNDARYGLWRDYDPADAVRFFTLRLHEAGIIKVTPNEVLSGFTDWRFLNELKRELRA